MRATSLTRPEFIAHFCNVAYGGYLDPVDCTADLTWLIHKYRLGVGQDAAIARCLNSTYNALVLGHVPAAVVDTLWLSRVGAAAIDTLWQVCTMATGDDVPAALVAIALIPGEIAYPHCPL